MPPMKMGVFVHLNEKEVKSLSLGDVITVTVRGKVSMLSEGGSVDLSDAKTSLSKTLPSDDEWSDDDD